MPLAAHLDVAHAAELGAEPAQLGAEVLRPVRVDEFVQCAEVGSQAPGRDAPGAPLRIAFRPERRLVGVEPAH